MKSKYIYENSIGINPEGDYWWLREKDDREDPFVEEYGFDQSETWSLDYTIIAFLYPRLRYLIEKTPVDWDADGLGEKINRICDTMGEYLSAEKNDLSLENRKEIDSNIQEQLHVFADIFHSLWW